MCMPVHDAVGVLPNVGFTHDPLWSSEIACFLDHYIIQDFWSYTKRVVLETIEDVAI